MPKRQRGEAAYPPAAFCRAYEANLVHEAREKRLIQCNDGWADRHDILHLIDLPKGSPPSPSSLSSWSLPSDCDDTFFLSGDELAEHAENKRRGWVEGLREARLKEREREDEERRVETQRAEDAVVNEPPTAEILNLMEHTARALAASPNPAALEMRIVTRQASDPRFGFLRPGAPSSAVWARVRAAAGVGAGAAVAKPKKDEKQGGLGGLGGYDSDSDDGHLPPPGSPPPLPPGSPPPPLSSPPPPPPDSP